MKKLTTKLIKTIGGRCYSKKSISALNKSKAFTLIELLVVIAIIGILAGVVIASLNSARTKGRVAAIKSNLKNLQTQAIMYHSDNGTFAGLCTYNTSGVSAHSSIQPMIDALISIAGSNNIRCVVRTSDVPASGSHFQIADSLETKNFGVAVYFNETHYAVDTTGVITLDSTNNGSTTNWQTAMDRCATAGKRLPSIEILKSINDYDGFLGSEYWSSTPSTGSYAYYQDFNNGNVFRYDTTYNIYVLCAA